ncbi:hypothetical protein V8G54_016965 [Vigna mungo]|uniref:Legume lectin domain-containing protein n=1 Tax=Vigna mungo TaxID=3915 RepID=A0AAQ3NL36_VIGMU
MFDQDMRFDFPTFLRNVLLIFPNILVQNYKAYKYLWCTATHQNGSKWKPNTRERRPLSILWSTSSLRQKAARVADFTTEFSFVVNTKGAPLHGDGFTFYLASLDFEFPDNSSGGFLGIFNHETAFNTSLNHVVAVEFDSFVNEWDPNFPVSDSPHIGIDINSIRSAATAPWPLESQPHGSIGKARISYQSSSKILSVSVDYPNSPVNATVLSYPVNLGAVLPEWVRFGFTGTTGDLVETHDILSWSFNSFI